MPFDASYALGSKPHGFGRGLPHGARYKSRKHSDGRPLAEVAQRLRHGVSQMFFETEREVLMLIMLNEAAWLSGSAEGEPWN